MRGAVRSAAQGHPRGLLRQPLKGAPHPRTPPGLSTTAASPPGCSSRNSRTYTILASAAAKRVAAESAAAAARQQAKPSIKLGASLKYLLSSLLLLPTFRGALSVFTRTAAASASATARTEARSHYAHLARTAFKPAHRGGLRSSGPSFRVVAAPRSLAHGAGLQTARNFSSSGTPFISDLVLNAPLALRALADEADEQLRKGKRASSAQRSATESVKKQRKEATLAKRVAKYFSPVEIAATASPVSEYATLEEELATPARVARAYAEYFAPAPATSAVAAEQSAKGPHPTRRTVLVMPADPHLALLIAPSTPSGASAHILDGFASDVREVTDAYTTHRLLINALQELMAKYGLPIPSFEQATRVPQAYALHGLAWELKFDGWTKQDVGEMLCAELGARGRELMCFLFEEDVEVEEQQPEQAGTSSPLLSEISFDATSPSSLASSELVDLGVDLDDFGAASWLSMNDHATPTGLDMDLELSFMGDEEVHEFPQELIMPTLDTSFASMPSPTHTDEELSSDDEHSFGSSLMS